MSHTHEREELDYELIWFYLTLIFSGFSWFYILREAVGSVLCIVAIYIISIQFLIPALRDDARAYHATRKSLDASDIGDLGDCKLAILLLFFFYIYFIFPWGGGVLPNSVKDIDDIGMLNFDVREGFGFSRRRVS